MDNNRLRYCVSKVDSNGVYLTSTGEGINTSVGNLSVVSPSFFSEYLKKYGYDYLNRSKFSMISDSNFYLLSCFPFYCDNFCTIDNSLVIKVKKYSEVLFQAISRCRESKSSEGALWSDIVRFKELDDDLLSLEFDTAVADSYMYSRVEFVIDRRMFEEGIGSPLLDESFILRKSYMEIDSNIKVLLDDYISSDVFLPAVFSICELVYKMLHGFNNRYKKLSDIFDVMLYFNCVPASEVEYKTGRFGWSFGYETEVPIGTLGDNYNNALICSGYFDVSDFNDVVVDTRFSKVSSGKSSLRVDSGIVSGIRLVACI